MNQENESQRLAAEAEALMALVDAELHSDDPTHPDHVHMPSDDEIAAMAKNAFDRASSIIDAQAILKSGRASDTALATIVATWTARLGSVSSTRKAESGRQRRAWKVRVNDSAVVTSILGPDATGPLSLTVTATPGLEGTGVTVTLPLNGRPSANVTLMAFIDYGDNVRISIPLREVDLGAAAEQLGVAELFGRAVVSNTVSTAPLTRSEAHPVVTLLVLASRS